MVEEPTAHWLNLILWSDEMGLAKYKFRVINKWTVIIKVDTDIFEEVDNIYFIINKSKIKRLFWLCFWENYNFSFGSVNLWLTVFTISSYTI